MAILSAIKKVATFDASIEKAWTVISTADGIASWWMPNDLKPMKGHTFHIQSPFGPSPCKVLAVDFLQQVTFAWDTDGWTVSFLLEIVNEKTQFTLIHDGWKEADAIIPKAGQPQAVVWKLMDQGWKDIVGVRLRQVLEG